jgi:aspartate carbamoyltransferase catalytic subunit
MPVTSAQQVTPAGLKLVMDFADQCKAICENGNGSCELLKGKIMAAIFYEARTRTNCSFQRCLLTSESVRVCLT